MAASRSMRARDGADRGEAKSKVRPSTRASRLRHSASARQVGPAQDEGRAAHHEGAGDETSAAAAQQRPGRRLRSGVRSSMPCRAFSARIDPLDRFARFAVASNSPGPNRACGAVAHPAALGGGKKGRRRTSAT
jgi:hypothetical protein